jgi:hypothetical protein
MELDRSGLTRAAAARTLAIGESPVLIFGLTRIPAPQHRSFGVGDCSGL